MATFISTHPDELLKRLAEQSKKPSLPKNKLIENVHVLYLDHLKSQFKGDYARNKLLPFALLLR